MNTSAILNELHNLRALALTAHDAIYEIQDEDEAAASAARVMGILAGRALVLANEIDAADLEAHGVRPVDAAGEDQSGDPGEASSGSDLVTDLHHELLFLDDYLQLAEVRALNCQKDGKLVALFDAAMPRLKRARKIVEEMQS